MITLNGILTNLLLKGCIASYAWYYGAVVLLKIE